MFDINKQYKIISSIYLLSDMKNTLFDMILIYDIQNLHYKEFHSNYNRQNIFFTWELACEPVIYYE